MGVIVKRPVANGAWGRGSSPYPYAEGLTRRHPGVPIPGPLGDREEARSCQQQYG